MRRVPFTWSAGGATIHSVIRRVEPGRSICWTGRLLHLHAIHCWTLTAAADGTVSVLTRESMEGLLITRLYSSTQLLAADQRWLAMLKRAAETGTTH